MHKPSKKRLQWMRLQNRFTILDLFTVLYYPHEEIKDLFDYDPFFECIEKAIKKSLYYFDIVDGYWNGERDISVLAKRVFSRQF